MLIPLLRMRKCSVSSVGRFVLVFGLAGLLYAESSAQVPEHEKYARLKTRLNTAFVKVGPSPGESIPAYRVYPRRDGHTDIEFSDATIHLGWYIAVLATENHLLRTHDKDSRENEKELYYALHALERLDANSNVAWSYWQNDTRLPARYDTAAKRWIPYHPVSEVPDGFLIRDDVPPFFYQNFPGMHLSSSDFTRHQTPDSYDTRNYGGEESKDQFISVLFGLFFVHRFVVPEAEYAGHNLHEYGRTITKRMVDYVRYERLNRLGSWKITNPEKHYLPAHLGYDPLLFSYPIAAIANEIVHDKRFSHCAATQYFRDTSKRSYQNGSSRLTKQVFVQLRDSRVILDKNYDWHVNYYMIFMLASVSNVWSHNLAFEKNSVEPLLKRCSDAESKGWLIYPLINYVLYPDGALPYDAAYVEKELALYPAAGAYNYLSTPGDSLGRYTRHWFSSNRFQSSNGHYEGNPAVDCNSYFNGAYNGLDYMMLYNLYRIAYAEHTKNIDYKSTL